MYKGSVKTSMFLQHTRAASVLISHAIVLPNVFQIDRFDFKNEVLLSPGKNCIVFVILSFLTLMVLCVQVGTRRYMAPEIMDGSIEATIFESFRKVDMYALALVIWEVATVCSPAEGET